jgi:hypothetical protein
MAAELHLSKHSLDLGRCRGKSVGNTYEIFKYSPGVGSIWIGSVEGLEEAIERTKFLAKINPGDYSLYDISLSKVIFQISSKPVQPFDGIELQRAS